MQDLFFWVIALVMIGLGLYTNYTNWTNFIKSRKEKELFMKNHKDAEMVRVAPHRFWWFILLTVLCIVFMVVLLIQDPATFTGAGQLSQAALYGGLGIFAFAIVPESIMDSYVASCPDGFMYETDYIRYKNINDIVIGTNFFKQTFMNVLGNKEIPLPKAVGKWALSQWEEYRANRKAARKKRGRKGSQEA